MEPVTMIIAGVAIVLTASLAYAVNKYREIREKNIEIEALRRSLNAYAETYAFENADEEWLNFVVNNRNGKASNDNADMHIGPVADDNVYQSIRLFETGAYDAEYTVKKLKTEVLHDQWTLHTDKILDYLTFIVAKEVR